MEKYLDMTQNKDYSKLKEAANIIKNGEIVIFPTETVYGIGTNGLNENAVEKLYNIKKRPKNKPISLLVSDIKMIENITKNITDLEYELINKFFPGPFTIILKRKKVIPDIVTANKDTVGVRMPEGEIARKLVEYAGVPIAAPSANISGKPSGITLEEVQKEFQGKVDYMINEGKAKLAIASTIVQVIDNIPHILRQGPISAKEIEKISGEVIIEYE